MNVEELESAVQRLTPADLARFSAWFEVYLAAKWDRQLEAHIVAGRLDRAARQADDDFEAGKCTPL